MLDTEGQWSEALASNNIRAIISWLRKFTAEGGADVEEILLTFSCWAQRTSEFAKKELLTLCFSRCQGRWMFLDRSSFSRVHMLLQRLRNLLTLAQWARRQLGSAHIWHGLGVPCVVCRDTFGSPDVRHRCWNREHRALKQHIWLGRLVQWWGIMGLLPKYPEAQEVKRIAQMWKEMGHSHRRACPETPGWEEREKGGFRSLIQGLVTQLDRQHGCIWTSEDCTYTSYPPPNLQALLKLVLVPHIDNMSVQALLMYFVLDMANFLQCKDDLHQSFCHAFTVPSSFSQQIRAFWMLDRGQSKASMELLLSPRAAAPRLAWQHHCIMSCLLTRKQPQLALKYLHWTRPVIERVEDAKLCADVLLQNSCVSEAWDLLKRSHTESDDMVVYFLQACDGFGLCAEALKFIPARYTGGGENTKRIETTGLKLPLMKKVGRPPCPLSAKLYQAQRVNTVSPEELVQLVRDAVTEVRAPHPKISEVVWPEHAERKSTSREMFLSTQALRHLTPSPSPMDVAQEKEKAGHADEPEDGRPVQNHLESPEHLSSSDNMSSGSVSSFTSASSLPPLKCNRPYVYESTVTLQRISSLLTDGEKQSREDEDEEDDTRNPSPADGLPGCAEWTVTLDGATDSIFLSDFDKDALVELARSAEEKMACCKDVSEEIVHSSPDVTDLWSPDDQSDILDEVFSFSAAATSEPYQDLLSDPHQSPRPDKPDAGASMAPAAMAQWDVSLLTQLQQISGSSLTHGTTFSIKTTTAPSDTSDKNSPTAQLKTDDPCIQLAWLDQCKSSSWWKQELETSGASSGLLPATEPGAAITLDHKKPPLALSQPYSHSVANFMDFTARQKGDNRGDKQADKEEPAGWSGLGRGSQGAIRSGRTRSRKGKRVRRA